jgi:anti-anti-sigma factor
VRLDLTELDFIDSSGLRELIVALDDARPDGWRLDIEPQLTAPVRRTVDIAGLTSYLWPDAG